MQAVDTRELDELSKDVDKVLKEIPKARQKLHTELADMLKSEVDTNISLSLNDSRGTIKGWQEKVVGTGGGYAVVRAIGTSTGKNSPGAITNYLESGHKIRRPSGAAKRPRRSRARMAYVDGRHFYQRTAATVEAPAIRLAENFVKTITKLGG